MPNAIPKGAVPLIASLLRRQSPCPWELGLKRGDILGPGLTSRVFFIERKVGGLLGDWE